MQTALRVLVLDDDGEAGALEAEGLGAAGHACRAFTTSGEIGDAEWDWADITVLDLQLGGGASRSGRRCSLARPRPCAADCPLREIVRACASGG
jgi:DNA-binding response OmpR family regulator